MLHNILMTIFSSKFSDSLILDVGKRWKEQCTIIFFDKPSNDNKQFKPNFYSSFAFLKIYSITFQTMNSTHASIIQMNKKFWRITSF